MLFGVGHWPQFLGSRPDRSPVPTPRLLGRAAADGRRRVSNVTPDWVNCRRMNLVIGVRRLAPTRCHEQVSAGIKGRRCPCSSPPTADPGKRRSEEAVTGLGASHRGEQYATRTPAAVSPKAGILAVHEGAHLPVVAPGMTNLRLIPRCCVDSPLTAAGCRAHPVMTAFPAAKSGLRATVLRKIGAARRCLGTDVPLPLVTEQEQRLALAVQTALPRLLAKMMSPR